MHNTLGKPDRVHVQNMEQLNAFDCHQNETEPQDTEYHRKVHMCAQTASQAQLQYVHKTCCTQAGPTHATGGDGMDR